MQTVIYLLLATHPNQEAIRQLVPSIRTNFQPLADTMGIPVDDLFPELAKLMPGD